MYHSSLFFIYVTPTLLRLCYDTVWYHHTVIRVDYILHHNTLLPGNNNSRATKGRPTLHSSMIICRENDERGLWAVFIITILSPPYHHHIIIIM